MPEIVRNPNMKGVVAKKGSKPSCQNSAVGLQGCMDVDFRYFAMES
ncbi:MAG: hypothetical protein LBU32_19530 [Clostridiales bacterium]|nr:hypothetical protein [Clostridiales bacterium]